MKKILVIALLAVFSASAQAQFDWAEGLNDFFSDFGRPNCAHEGEIADKPCCTGLHEQYDGYLGEIICTEYRETQITQQSTQNTPTQVSYPESEPVCYADDYCQYVNGEGWKCNAASNRCYYDIATPSSSSIIETEKIIVPINEEELPQEEFRTLSQNPQFYNTYNTCQKNTECTENLGKNYVCDVKQKKCVEFKGVYESSICYFDTNCETDFGKGWFCDKRINKCSNLFTESPLACDYDSECVRKFGNGWYCDIHTNRCTNNKYMPNADIVFVPINYETGDDENFRQFAINQFNEFKRLAPNQCPYLSNIAFLKAGECTSSCNSACKCLFDARRCAISNNYEFTKRVVGVLNSKTPKFVAGCGYVVGKVSVISADIFTKYTDSSTTLAHELGHNFGFIHVDSSRCLIPPFMNNACKYRTLYPPINIEDCNLPLSDQAKDIMSYCSSRTNFGPKAFEYLSKICSTKMAENEQKILLAYVTVDREGSASINSIYLGEGTLENEEGDYDVIAYDNNKEIISEDFNVEFLVEEEIVNEDGTMTSKPIELQKFNTIVMIPYSPNIDEIKIEHNGQVLVAKDLSEIAAGGSMFAQTSDGNTQITTLPEDIAEKQGITITNVAYEQKEENLVYNVEGTKTELFLGFIPIDERVTATYDSTGNLLNYHQKPWWQFWG